MTISEQNTGHYPSQKRVDYLWAIKNGFDGTFAQWCSMSKGQWSEYGIDVEEDDCE